MKGKPRSFLAVISVCAFVLGLCGFAVMISTTSVRAEVIEVTNTDDSGDNSLRWAIERANSNPGPDTINFNIDGSGPHVITLTSGPLPGLTDDDTTINGYSEPDADEGPLGQGTSRVIAVEIDRGALGGGPSGLKLDNCQGCVIEGLAIHSFQFNIEFAGSDASNNVVEGCYLGTDAGGTVEHGADHSGVLFNVDSSDNLVGGTGLDDGNAGNLISGSGSAGVYAWPGSLGNTVQGNYIGTNVSGTADMSNNVGIMIVDCDDNEIGGDTAGEGNLVSGNDSYGIAVAADSSNNYLYANWVGIDSTGANALANGEYGVVLSLGAQNNIVGGNTPTKRNVISGNGIYGMFIGNPGTGSNTVSGNYIGTDHSGSVDVGNVGFGIWIGDESTDNTIGGESPGTGNVISGNGSIGLAIHGGSQNHVWGNVIGLDSTGSTVIPNGTAGIELGEESQNNEVGGVNSARMNTVSGNTMNGIRMSGTSDRIRGNRIGTDSTGSLSLPNNDYGIFVASTADQCTIGGSETAENVIRYNREAGIAVTSNGRCEISYNTVTSNSGDGVLVESSSNCDIENNTVGSNEGNGIKFLNSTDNEVSSNRIRYNAGAGVVVQDANSFQDRISQNSIFGNGALGIDLGGDGVTPNDGNNSNGQKPNRGYNYPEFSGTGFSMDSTGTVPVYGTAPPGSTVELYLTGTPPDSSDHGQGLTYLASTTADSGGSFSATLSGLSVGDVISSIAIGPYGNTSEFSSNAEITRYEPPRVLGSTRWFLAEGSTGAGFDTWILLQNPQERAADVQVTFTTLSGPREPITVTMIPESRATIRIAEYVPDEFHVSTIIESSAPIVAERSMYWDKNVMGESDTAGTPEPYEMKSGHANLGTPVEQQTSRTRAESGSTKRYFAEGATAGGFDTWILLCNTTNAEATAQVSLMTEEGLAVQETVTVPALSRQTVHLDDYLPDAFNVATEVVSDTPLVAERSMYWDPEATSLQPYEMRGGHSNDGSPSGSTDWFLAEGSTGMGFETYILLQNPGEEEAQVTATFMDLAGVVAEEQITMPAQSRSTLKVSDYAPDNWQVATSVSSDRPVVAERSMYWDKRVESEPYSMRDGHSTVGEISTNNLWMVPEGSTGKGFDSWVLLTNPTDGEASVSVTFMTNAGPQTRINTTLVPNSRSNFHVNEYVDNNFHVSTLVESDVGLVVERAMYWDRRERAGIQPFEMMGGHSAPGIGPE